MKRLGLMAGMLALTGCALFGQGEVGRSAGGAAPDMIAGTKDGARLYRQHCRVCHGRSGTGDGRLGGDLPVRPSDLTLLSARNGGTFPAARVLEVIHGDPGTFHRGTMPKFDRIMSGPVREWRAPDGTWIMTPKGLLDIVTYVESLQV